MYSNRILLKKYTTIRRQKYNRLVISHSLRQIIKFDSDASFFSIVIPLGFLIQDLNKPLIKTQKPLFVLVKIYILFDGDFCSIALDFFKKKKGLFQCLLTFYKKNGDFFFSQSIGNHKTLIFKNGKENHLVILFLTDHVVQMSVDILFEHHLTLHHKLAQSFGFQFQNIFKLLFVGCETFSQESAVKRNCFVSNSTINKPVMIISH